MIVLKRTAEKINVYDFSLSYIQLSLLPNFVMNNFVPVGKSRFIYFLNKVEGILNQAATSEDPGRLIYSQDMRTPLFMLEALSRIYKKILAPEENKKNK